MVAAAVPRFGMIVEPNLARCFLHRSHAALEAGNILEAGVLLREAIRRQLVAECTWHDCLPQGFSDRTSPRVLLKAMRNAGHVAPNKIKFAITIMHGSIDNDPCGEPRERVEHCLPAVDDCDCGDDDDDPADWWKGGAA